MHYFPSSLVVGNPSCHKTGSITRIFSLQHCRCVALILEILKHVILLEALYFVLPSQILISRRFPNWLDVKIPWKLNFVPKYVKTDVVQPFHSNFFHNFFCHFTKFVHKKISPNNSRRLWQLFCRIRKLLQNVRNILKEN